MVELVLTGPYKGISAYGCFAIKINIPPATASSSSGDAGGLIQWEWDCYDPKYAAQVDQLPVSHTISESTRMNPVRDAIARGWDTGTGFTKQLMTDYVWKYVEMSRRLRHWKRGNYAERRPDSELGDIYLVLNGNPFSLKCAFNPLKYDHFQNIIAFFMI